MSTVVRAPAKVLQKVRSYVGANAALLVTAAVGAAAFSLLITGSADIYQSVASGNGLSGLDRPALDLAISLRTPAGDRWVTAFTNLGGTASMVFITLTLTIALYVHWWRRSILLMMVIASAGSLIFTSVGKTIVGRARPPLALAIPPYEYAPSFPSVSASSVA